MSGFLVENKNSWNTLNFSHLLSSVFHYIFLPRESRDICRYTNSRVLYYKSHLCMFVRKKERRKKSVHKCPLGQIKGAYAKFFAIGPQLVVKLDTYYFFYLMLYVSYLFTGFVLYILSNFCFLVRQLFLSFSWCICNFVFWK